MQARPKAVSDDVVIMTWRELDAHCQKAFERGVERGKFECSTAYREGPYARNCANWKDGHCETCGAQSQYFEVDADFKCPKFTNRRHR